MSISDDVIIDDLSVLAVVEITNNPSEAGFSLIPYSDGAIRVRVLGTSSVVADARKLFLQATEELLAIETTNNERVHNA